MGDRREEKKVSEKTGLVMEETVATRCCGCQRGRSALDRSRSISGEIFSLVAAMAKRRATKRAASGRPTGREESVRENRVGGGGLGRDALLRLPRWTVSSRPISVNQQ